MWAALRPAITIRTHVILSENRCPLFRIMPWPLNRQTLRGSGEAAGPTRFRRLYTHTEPSLSARLHCDARMVAAEQPQARRKPFTQCLTNVELRSAHMLERIAVEMAAAGQSAPDAV